MGVFENHFALVVGVEHYPKWGANKRLTGASADAKAVYAWLTDTETGGGVPSDNAVLIPSTEEPPHPLDDHVDDALERILEAAAESEPEGRRLYFYFSGHGAALEPRGLALCLTKWSKNRRAALDAKGYLDFAQGSGVFDEVIFFLDCCRNRVVKPAANPPDLIFYIPGQQANRARSLMAYATEHTDRSFEVEVAEDQRRGIFTSVLLDVLRAAPDDGGTGISLGQLRARLEAEVPLRAKAHELAQRPEMQHDFPTDREPRFGQMRGAGDLIIDARADRAEVVLYDGENVELARWSGADGPRSFQLPSSLLLLEDTASGEQTFIRYRSTPGEEIRVQF